MRHSETIGKLSAALVAAQAELAPIAKDSVNPHFKNRYASLDTIIHEVRPTLARHGFAIIQSADALVTAGEVKLTAITVETMLIHESGEWLSNTAVVPVQKADPQGAGGALTYGRRYGLAALLSLATEEDDDGNAAARQTQQRAAPPRQAQQAAQPAKKAEPEKKRDESGENVLRGLLKNEHVKDDERAKMEAWLKADAHTTAELLDACQKVEALIVKREGKAKTKAA